MEMNAEEYIKQRLDDQINWYDKRSTASQRRYKFMIWLAELRRPGLIRTIRPAHAPGVSDVEVVGDFLVPKETKHEPAKNEQNPNLRTAEDDPSGEKP